MTELTDDEKKYVEAMKAIGAVAPDKLKTVEDVSKRLTLPKNQVANKLIELTNKKIVKRVARDKSAGYYVLPGF